MYLDTYKKIEETKSKHCANLRLLDTFFVALAQ